MLTCIVTMTNRIQTAHKYYFVLLAHSIKAMLQKTYSLIFGPMTLAFFKANAHTPVYYRQIPSHANDLFWFHSVAIGQITAVPFGFNIFFL